MSVHVAANIHLQLGKLLVLYTENYEAARDSLELAVGISIYCVYEVISVHKDE